MVASGCRRGKPTPRHGRIADARTTRCRPARNQPGALPHRLEFPAFRNDARHSCPAVVSRAVDALRAVHRAVVRRSRRAPARAPRRRPLRRDRARDGRHRRLGHAASQRTSSISRSRPSSTGRPRRRSRRSASTSGRRGCGRRWPDSSRSSRSAMQGWALGGAALGVFAGLALAGPLWHAGIAQIVTLDSGLAFFLALGIRGVRRRAACRDHPRPSAARWMWLVWAAMAGATLSKGLIGLVLPGGALVAYTAITRDFALWRRLSLGSGFAIYLALTAPWFVAVARDQRRIPAVLLRPRASAALSDYRASARRARGTTSSRFSRRGSCRG